MNIAEGDDLNITNREAIETGVEWKVTRSMALTASTARTTTERDFLAASGDTKTLSRLNDEQLSLGLSRRTSAGNWLVQVSNHTLNDSITGNTDTKAQSIKVQAERKVSSNLRLKGTWNVANDVDLARDIFRDTASRNVEAQWSLSPRSRLDLRFNDWENSNSGSDYFKQTGSNELGLKFNWASENNGKGLGLNVEYARRDTPNPDERERYRIGITYK
jgi:hypothetical protein